MSVLKNEERETHINMLRNSDKMQIYTSEIHVMKMLDKYVEESEDWKLTEIGKCHGEIVSKTYEAPRNLLIIRKKKRELSEEQRQKAAERLRAFWKKKNADEPESPALTADESDMLDDDCEGENFGVEDTGEGDFEPEKVEPYEYGVAHEEDLMPEIKPDSPVQNPQVTMQMNLKSNETER